MARYDFSAFKVNTESEKALPRLEHEFRPIEDDQDICVVCEHFKAGEKMRYMNISEDGRFSFDFRRIVESKVRSISGLTLTVTDEKTGKRKDIEVTDPRTLLAFPDEGIVSRLVTAIATHLVSADSLTEEESKN